MWLIFVLWSWLMAGNAPTTLYFSAGGGCPWQHATANGQILGAVPDSQLEPEVGCYGMGRLQDGTIWMAAERYFHTFNASLTKRSGGTVPVETIAGASGRHLYRIRRGQKLQYKPPQLEHAPVLEEIDPRRWSVTRAWNLPGTYRSYGRGHLAIDLDESIAYYAKEGSSGTIHRHDLKADIVLPDLVSRPVSSGGLIVLRKGSIVVGYTDRAQRFAPDGELLNTYDAGAIRTGQGLVTHGATGATFWLQGFDDGAEYSTLYEFAAEDGTVRHQWNTPNNGVIWDAPFVDPPYTLPIPEDTALITDDGCVTGLALVDTTTGAMIGYTDPGAFACGAESGCVMLDGTIGTPDKSISQGDGRFGIYDRNLSLIVNATIGNPSIDNVFLVGVTTDRMNYFYVVSADSLNNLTLHRVTKAGATLQTWNLATVSGVDPVPCAVTRDNASFYFDDLGTIKKLNLSSGSISTATTLSTPSKWIGIDIVGNIYVNRQPSTIPLIEKYNASVGLQGSVNAGPSTYGIDTAHFSSDDAHVFAWTQKLSDVSHPSKLSAFRKIRLSDLAVISDVTDVPTENNSDFIVPGVSISDSCPLMIAAAGETTFMSCLNPCEDAGVGEPYFAFIPEGTDTIFYDRQFTKIAIFGSPSPSTTVGVALAPSTEGVWAVFDDNFGGTSYLFLLDPATGSVIRGPITTEVRIAELGGRRAFWILGCNLALTVDRTTHELIALCIPATDAEIATVVLRFHLVINPLDGALVDGAAGSVIGGSVKASGNLLYIDSGVAKVWSLKNDALLRTVGTVGGIWPTVLNDSTFCVFSGVFRGQGDVLRYTRNGKLVRRYTYNQPEFSAGLYNINADLETDACDCGNQKDGLLFLPGEDAAAVIRLRLLSGEAVPNEFGGGTASALPDIVEGGIDTASAFIVIGAINTGSSFDQQTSGGGGTRRPSPNRHCGPEARLATPAPNPGCNAGGKGWTPTYNGASGTVPSATDPTLGETMTGKTAVYPEVAIAHVLQPSGTVETLQYATVELDDTQRKEGRIESIGDDERGLSDAQGNLISSTTKIRFQDSDGRPFGIRLADSTKKYWARNELLLRMRSDVGRRTAATPRMIGRGVLHGEQYGSPVVFEVEAVDPITVDGGAFSPDKRVSVPYPLSYYTDAPPDLAQRYMPIILGEVSDEGAISPVTGLPNSRGKCPAIYVGMDVLGTAPGGEPWGRFNLCLFASYKVVALYGSDLGGMNLYGRSAVASVVEAHESDDPDAQTNAVESTAVALDGSPDLTAVATDGTMQIVVWAVSGRSELVITGADNFAKTVTVEGSLDPTFAQGVPWYISSIDYVPRRVKIDLSTRNGVDVQVPTWAGYIRPTAYEDFSCADGAFRVTDCWARGPLISAHLAGEVTLAVNMIGIDATGNGAGNPITSYFTGFNWWLDNRVHRQVTTPPASGTQWPQVAGDLPAWADGVSKTKSSTFAAAQAQTVLSLGGNGLQVNAYFTDETVRDALQLWNDNGGCRTQIDEYGRVGVWLLDAYADTSTYPRVEHVSRVFGDVRRWRALDEAMNVIQGGCDYDPDGQQFREDNLSVSSTDAITRNGSVKRFSKHYDGKLVATKSQFLWLLNRQLAVHQDGPVYVSIERGDIGLLDYPVGSGILFTSIMGPGTDGYVDQPLIILRRTFHVDSQMVSLVCLDLGASVEGSLVIPSAQQFILTNNVNGPKVSNDLTLAPVLAA